MLPRLHVAPLFHLVDAYAVFAITWVGGRHVILPAFDGRGVAAAVGERRVTVSNVASTMVTLCVEINRWNALSSNNFKPL